MSENSKVKEVIEHLEGKKMYRAELATYTRTIRVEAYSKREARKLVNSGSEFANNGEFIYMVAEE